LGKHIGRLAAGLLFLLIASAFLLVFNLFGAAAFVFLKALLNPSDQILSSVIMIVMAVILAVGAIYVLGWLVQRVGRRGRRW